MEDKLAIYESLLNELASLEKECIFLQMDYYREFGEEINAIFTLKVDCITLKKKIAYCVKKINNSEKIDIDEMEEYIEFYIGKYKKQLSDMIKYKKYVDKEKGSKVSFDDKREIKRLYYKIVHLIHPDLHPELQDDKKIKDLWNQCVDAYKRNDLHLIKRVFDQVIIITGGDTNIVLDSIGEKILTIEKEIKEIKDNDPYKYKFILEDEEEMISIHSKNREAEKYFKKYKDSLLKELSNYIDVNKRKSDA